MKTNLSSKLAASKNNLVSLQNEHGKLVEIDHGNGYITRYVHNDELLVKAGDGISAGHVHFEVLCQSIAVNPSQFANNMR